MSVQPFTMVIGVDLSDYADAVLEHGYDQALRHDRAMVRVVTVIEDPRNEPGVRQRLTDLVQRTLDDVVPSNRREGLSVFAHVRAGRPDEEIVELAEECVASLIVVGRFGVHRRKHNGSVADPIVAAAGCPVLVVPPPRDTSASDLQCPDCVALRAESDGETWFCERHHGEHLGLHSIAAISSGAEPSRSMW